MGILATRTPHRPNPIGLSLCRIVAVENDSVLLAGADLVHGTPVLDMKPYVPFCEAKPQSKCPEWVSVCPANSHLLARCHQQFHGFSEQGPADILVCTVPYAPVLRICNC